MARELPLRRFFISYSHMDEEFIEPVVQLLRATGAPLFRDRDEIRAGQKWRAELHKQLQQADVIVVFWSKHASTSVEVEAEWRRAVELGKDVIPVLLDGTPLNTVLSEYQYIDLGSIMRVGHPMDYILKELGELILYRLEGVTADQEQDWWRALRRRWGK
jgi:TIR domain